MDTSDNSQPNGRRIIIFDTTLRDGEQSPGASMNLAEKVEVAHALADLGVDVIEAGFPIASPGDFESVREIAKAVKGPSVCGLCRCRDKDIDVAWEALAGAEHPRIHVFLATSAIHREHKLRMDRDQIIERAVEGVRRARNYCDDVEFSPEDASRTEIDFLREVVEKVIEAGATTVNIPDTVGYSTPEEMAERIRTLRETVPNIDRAVLSVHCHDDLGMAVANSLAAVRAGAGQVECTVNGIGERAGNASLEEIVMALRTRSDFFDCHTNVQSKRLIPTSRMVSHITGLLVPRNKAIVGRNAFAHESGIHQDGMLKERTTYEIMSPEDVGLTESDLVLGKHSGRAALGARAKALGFTLDQERLQEVFEQFKILADKKKEVYDGDIVALCEGAIREVEEAWTLLSVKATVDTGSTPQATITVRQNGETESVSIAAGDGPVDAVFLAIRELTGLDIVCNEYRVHSVTVGQDAQGEVAVQVEYGGELYRGRAFSTDTLEASARAFLDAANRIVQSGRDAKSEA